MPRKTPKKRTPTFASRAKQFAEKEWPSRKDSFCHTDIQFARRAIRGALREFGEHLDRNMKPELPSERTSR